MTGKKELTARARDGGVGVKVMGCFISSLLFFFFFFMLAALLIRDQHEGVFWAKLLCTNPFGAGYRGYVGREDLKEEVSMIAANWGKLLFSL